MGCSLHVFMSRILDKRPAHPCRLEKASNLDRVGGGVAAPLGQDSPGGWPGNSCARCIA